LLLLASLLFQVIFRTCQCGLYSTWNTPYDTDVAFSGCSASYTQNY